MGGGLVSVCCNRRRWMLFVRRRDCYALTPGAIGRVEVSGESARRPLAQLLRAVNGGGRWACQASWRPSLAGSGSVAGARNAPASQVEPAKWTHAVNSARKTVHPALPPRHGGRTFARCRQAFVERYRCRVATATSGAGRRCHDRRACIASIAPLQKPGLATPHYAGALVSARTLP